MDLRLEVVEDEFAKSVEKMSLEENQFNRRGVLILVSTKHAGIVCHAREPEERRYHCGPADN